MSALTKEDREVLHRARLFTTPARAFYAAVQKVVDQHVRKALLESGQPVEVPVGAYFEFDTSDFDFVRMQVAADGQTATCTPGYRAEVRP